MIIQSKKNIQAAQGYAVTVLFEVKSSFYRQFLALVHDNAKKSVQLEPDCLQFDVLTPSTGEKTDTVFLYEIYKNRAGFDDHLASDHFQHFDIATKNMVLQKTVLDFSVDKNIKV